MGEFKFEWWTIDIRDECGRMGWEFKGKDRDHVIKQIEKEIKSTNSKRNASSDVFHRRPKILEVYWDTLQLNRIGYTRKF